MYDYTENNPDSICGKAQISNIINANTFYDNKKQCVTQTLESFKSTILFYIIEQRYDLLDQFKKDNKIFIAIIDIIVPDYDYIVAFCNILLYML